jgi:sterol desaturase/sphingolipid hydroxylase (fatty acid hydroxylase superfamily)
VLTFAILVVGLAVIPPLEARFGPRSPRRPLRPNLLLIPLVILTSAAIGVLEVSSLDLVDEREVGLIPFLGLDGAAALAFAVLGLDLAGYAGHRIRHRIGVLWACHRTHHTDVDVDVTTTLRHHPLDVAGIIVVNAITLLVLGCSPAQFAIFGVVATLFGLWDHLRIQMPLRLERAFGLVLQTPGLHRVHHSPHQTETDTNFGLVFTFWDRLFGTYRPVGTRGEVGLDTTDLTDRQSVRAMLVEPRRPLVKASSDRVADRLAPEPAPAA